ncbi:MAG: hypothetical protein ACRDOD_09865, partial [Streptosporangiaceae bacterium]
SACIPVAGILNVQLIRFGSACMQMPQSCRSRARRSRMVELTAAQARPLAGVRPVAVKKARGLE